MEGPLKSSATTPWVSVLYGTFIIHNGTAPVSDKKIYAVVCDEYSLLNKKLTQMILKGR